MNLPTEEQRQTLALLLVLLLGGMALLAIGRLGDEMTSLEKPPASETRAD